jgi:hypothetical protein
VGGSSPFLVKIVDFVQKRERGKDMVFTKNNGDLPLDPSS